MHVKLTLETEGELLTLPIHHQHMLQGLVYDLMGEKASQFVHSVGFPVDGRALRLFTFSRLMAPYQVKGQQISFRTPATLMVSSPIDLVARQWASSLLERGEVRLGTQIARLTSIEIARQEVRSNVIRVKTLSPITVYATLYKYDGSPYTCYFEPGETEFARLLTHNLLRKARVLDVLVAEDAKVSLKPLGKAKMAIIKYKGGIIKGYSGRFELSGPKPLLQIGMEAGFGSKNPQGFGLCVLGGGRS